MCPLLTKETVLGPWAWKNGATVEGPASSSVAYYVPTRNRYVVLFGQEPPVPAQELFHSASPAIRSSRNRCRLSVSRCPAPTTAAQRSQARSAGNQEHDEELILHGIGRLDAGKNLARHHARQGNKTDCMPLMVGMKPLR